MKEIYLHYRVSTLYMITDLVYAYLIFYFLLIVFVKSTITTYFSRIIYYIFFSPHIYLCFSADMSVLPYQRASISIDHNFVNFYYKIFYDNYVVSFTKMCYDFFLFCILCCFYSFILLSFLLRSCILS